jgi:hypothetical protein
MSGKLGHKRMRTTRTTAVAIGAGLLAAGCSGSPASLPTAGHPSYVGGPQQTLQPVPAPHDVAASPRVSSGKVLSAIVFERVTGLEVDPARLIEP